MTIQLGDRVPDFTAETTMGPLSFYDWVGDDWVILFSHPKDFTPVCTTELGRAAHLKDAFRERGVKLIALSVDALETHEKWIKDIEQTQKCVMNIPMIADADAHIAQLYGMIHPKADNTSTVRACFVIGPDKTLRLTLTYPASTGRNFDELLRVVDSLQLTDKHQVGTPVDWKAGGECVILPTVPDDQVEELFPKGHKVVKPYLRTTPQP